MRENVSSEREGAFAEPEYVPPMRKIGKEEFVRRMMSDAHRREIDIKEKRRQKIRVINEYRGESMMAHYRRMKAKGIKW